MVRIIDATLSRIDQYDLTTEDVCRFIELMGRVGVRDLQISINIYNILNGYLPQGFNYYLEVDTISYISKTFPRDDKIKVYFTPKQYEESNQVPYYQINDIEEHIRFEITKENHIYRVNGLDNLILGGCKLGLEVLKKKFRFDKMILGPENTYNCATAIALLFLQNKGYAVVGSVYGIGNGAATEQILIALHVVDRYMVKQDFSDLVKIREWMESVLKLKIRPMSPVLGQKIFYVESGVHVDGILKKPTNYEPYEPELVGLKRKIVLGKHSGKNSVKYKIEELKPGSNAVNHIDKILEEVKGRCINAGKSISEDDFIKIIERYEDDEKIT